MLTDSLIWLSMSGIIMDEAEIERGAYESAYEKFCHTHSLVQKRGIALDPLELKGQITPRPTEYNRNPLPFEVVHEVSPTDYVAIFAAIDKEEDAIGVSKRPDQVINIAVADGVSNTLLPKLASRVAIETALDDLDSSSPASLTLRNVFEKLKRQNLDSMVGELVNMLAEKATVNPTRLHRVLLDRAERLRKLGHISATTLSLIQYDRQKSSLRIAVKGDSSVVLFRRDGTYKVYTDPENHQIDYQGTRGKYYSTVGDIVESMELDIDDVVMVCSDGVNAYNQPEGSEYKDVFDYINHNLKLARQAQPQQRLDYIPTACLRKLAELEGIHDDVTLGVIQHK